MLAGVVKKINTKNIVKRNNILKKISVLIELTKFIYNTSSGAEDYLIIKLLT